jgi:hypothetical protein
MPSHEDIAIAAYHLWEDNPESDAEANWLAAEAKLLATVPDSELLRSPDVVSQVAKTPAVRG